LKFTSGSFRISKLKKQSKPSESGMRQIWENLKELHESEVWEILLEQGLADSFDFFSTTNGCGGF